MGVGPATRAKNASASLGDSGRGGNVGGDEGLKEGRGGGGGGSSGRARKVVQPWEAKVGNAAARTHACCTTHDARKRG